MSESAAVMEGFDVRWHLEIDSEVKDLIAAVKGNGERGLKERMNIIEAYVETAISREEKEAAERRSNRTLYRLASFAGVLSLGGLLIMSVLDHTLLKQVSPPQVVQTVTTTDSSSTSTTKTQKPTGR